AGWTKVEVFGYECTPRSPPLIPRYVVVSPNASHIAVDRTAMIEIRTASGEFVTIRGLYDGPGVTALDDAFYLRAGRYTWKGEGGEGFPHDGDELVMRIVEPRRTSVTNSVENFWADPHGGEPRYRPPRDIVSVKSKVRSDLFISDGDFKEVIEG